MDNKLVSVQVDLVPHADTVNLQELGYDELVELGKGVFEVKTYTQWILGKIGDAVSVKYGDLVKYAKDVGQKYEVLQVYTSIYRKFVAEDPDFTPDKYHGSVPWGVLQLVASKSDMPVTLLNELVDKGVTSFDHAYREIKTKQTGKDVPKKPRISLVFDDVSGKWKIRLRQEELDLIDWTDVKEQLMNYLSGLM